MRVALAAVLFAEPDLLLLDEPTNYLDLEGTLWLENYLARYPHTVIIISHDRDLLNTAVDSICHLDDGKLTLLSRRLSTVRAPARASAGCSSRRCVKKQEAQRKHMQAFVDRFRAKASKARQAQSRLKVLAKLEPIAALVDDERAAVPLPEPAKPLSPPIIAMDDVAVGYEPGKPVLTRPDAAHRRRRPHRAARRQRQRQVDLRQAARRPARSRMHGTITRAAGLKVAYFAQHQLDELDAGREPPTIMCAG